MKQTEQKPEMDMAVPGTAKMTGDGVPRAPVHILRLGDPRIKKAYPIRTKLEKAESHFITGLADAALLVRLAATSQGLASQYVSDTNSPDMETMLKALMKKPKPLRMYHLVPIGYAKGQGAAPGFKSDAALRDLRPEQVSHRRAGGGFRQDTHVTRRGRKKTRSRGWMRRIKDRTRRSTLIAKVANKETAQ